MALGQCLAVFEEEEGRPVQAHRRLAGARATLDEEALVERRTDDLVLLGGDRGDDVGHLAGAAPLDLGEHRVGNAGGGDRVGIVELLVEDGDEFVDLGDEPAPARQAERVGRGGPVEGDRDRCPPVDDHRRAVGVLDVAAADVPLVAVGDDRILVDPAEAEGHVTDVDGGSTLGQLRPSDAGVGRVLVADPLLGELERSFAPCDHRVECVAGPGQVRLLGFVVGVAVTGIGRGGHRGPQGVSLSSSFQVRNRSWRVPVGPNPSPDPSG